MRRVYHCGGEEENQGYRAGGNQQTKLRLVERWPDRNDLELLDAIREELKGIRKMLE